MASLIFRLENLDHNVLKQQDVTEVLPRNITEKCQYAIVPSIDAETQITSTVVTSDCHVIL
jgi:hypothetical protein